MSSVNRRNMLTIRLDRRARRLESNNRERRRMHELNAAFQVNKCNDPRRVAFKPD